MDIFGNKWKIYLFIIQILYVLVPKDGCSKKTQNTNYTATTDDYYTKRNISKYVLKKQKKGRDNEAEQLFW